MSKLKLDFLASSLTQPRLINRAKLLAQVCTVRVAGFSRGLYEENKFPEGVTVYDLGAVDYGVSFSRIFPFVKLFICLIRTGGRGAIAYATSLDTLIMALLCGRRTVVYELGDLRMIETPNSPLARLERYLIKKHCTLVVITSPGFYREYFSNYGLPESKFLVLENKVTESEEHVILSNQTIDTPRRKPLTGSESRPITIGVVGFLRYERPLKYLKEFVVALEGKYRLEVFGDGGAKKLFQNLRADEERLITYHGPFKSPDRLASIYSSIDVCFAVYDSHSENVMLAIPNKYFQCMFFETPILAAKDTALCSRVTSQGFGQPVDLTDYISFRESMMALDWDCLQSCKKKIAAVERKSYVVRDRDIAQQFEKRISDIIELARGV